MTIVELRQLTYFVAVAEQLSFSRAARKCYISQSAISHQIARLEQDLDVLLFERSTRAVALTHAGERLLPLATQMLGLESAIQAEMRSSGNRVRLAANMTFAASSLPAITAVRAGHPDAEIEFVLKSFQQRIAAVRDGDCDLALIRGEIDDPALRVAHLWTEDLMIATARSHPLAAAETVELADLRAYRLLMPPPREQVLLHSVIRAAFAEQGLEPLVGPPIPLDHTATLELITHPNAWTVLYAGTPPDGIAFLRERHRRLRIAVSAVERRASPPSPVRSALIAALRQP